MPGQGGHIAKSLRVDSARLGLIQSAAIILGVGILFVILWWEPGLKMAPPVEAWSFHNEFSQGLVFLPGLIAQNRPGASLVFYLGYVLTPNSFVGLGTSFIVYFVGRGLVLYVLLRKLFPSMQQFAAAVGLLVVVYPFDHGSMVLRYTAYQAHSLLILIAAYLLILYYERAHWSLAVGIVVVQVFTLSIYEVAFSAFLIIPLLLTWLEGGVNRRVLLITLGWYVVPIAMGLNHIRFLSTADATYQRELLSTAAAVDLSLRDISRLLLRPFQVGLFQEWKRAGSIALIEPAYRLPAALGAIVTGVVVLLHGHDETVLKHQRALPWIGGFGILFMEATFLPFIAVPQRVGNLRVFIIPTLGAALVFLSIFGYALHRFVYAVKIRRTLFAGVAALLVGMGTAWSVQRHSYIYDISRDQQLILAQTATLAPDVDDQAVLVLFGDEQLLTFDVHLFAFEHFGKGMDAGHFADAVRWIYDNPDLEVRLCFLKYESCTLTQTGLQGADRLVRYEWVIGLYFDGERMRVLEDLPTTLDDGHYDPWSLINGDAPVPYRVDTALRAVEASP